MTEREFDKRTSAVLEPLVRPFGFTEYEEGYFNRPRGNIQDVFFLDPLRGAECYHVYVGIHIPSQRAKSVFIDGIDQPSPEISERLGALLPSNEINKSYACATEEQFNRYIVSMFDDFKSAALPWYDQFKSLADVARYFREHRLDTTPAQLKRHGPRPPDPFGWAMYGWMMEETGRHDEAQKWWRKAYDEVRRPVLHQNGQVVSGGTRGARPLPRSQEEQRLEELLRQSLQRRLADQP